MVGLESEPRVQDSELVSHDKVATPQIHISETDIFRGTHIDPCKKGSKFSAPQTDAGEFVASQTAHIG